MGFLGLPGHDRYGFPALGVDLVLGQGTYRRHQPIYEGKNVEVVNSLFRYGRIARGFQTHRYMRNQQLHS